MLIDDDTLLGIVAGEGPLTMLELVELVDIFDGFKSRTRRDKKNEMTREKLVEMVNAGFVAKKFLHGAYQYAITDLGAKHLKANLK